MGVRSYEDLEVWQEAMSLAAEVYGVASRLPREERYGLAMQLRRAAVSVPSNIAEGQARRTRGEFLHFLGIASGSLAELVTELRLGLRVSMLEPVHVLPTIERAQRVGRMLSGLKKRLAPSPGTTGGH